MVISHVNRYLFVEIPQTASTSLAEELVKHYDGHRIFRKHTDYDEFLRGASAAERQYRVVATVRNPLDIVVSKFVKARDDHGHHYAERKDARSTVGIPFSSGSQGKGLHFQSRTRFRRICPQVLPTNL